METTPGSKNAPAGQAPMEAPAVEDPAPRTETNPELENVHALQASMEKPASGDVALKMMKTSGPENAHARQAPKEKPAAKHDKSKQNQEVSNSEFKSLDFNGIFFRIKSAKNDKFWRRSKLCLLSTY